MPDCTGGQNFQSPNAQQQGLERQAGAAVVGLVRRAIGCPAAWKLVPCPSMTGYLEGVRGTPNHRLLLRIWRLFAARELRDVSEIQAGRRHLVDFLERQFTTEGVQWGESLTTNHDWLWLLGFTGARLLARHYGEDEVAELAGRSLAACLYHWRSLDWHGHVIGPCSRGTLPYSELRDVAFALLDEHPLPTRIKDPTRPLAAANPDSPWWRDVYNVGAWQLRWLIRDGDDLVDHDIDAPLRNEVTIERRGDDLVAYFEHLTKASDALWWAAAIDGKITASPWQHGDIRNQDNPYKVPALGLAAGSTIPGIHRQPGQEPADEEEGQEDPQ